MEGNAMKKGFALIYAIIIVFLIMITITSITVMTLRELRETRQDKASTGAYELASSAIEDGMYQKRHGSLVPRRYYVATNSFESLTSPFDNDKASRGYYEVDFPDGMTKGVGYGVWGTKFLKVTLQNMNSLRLDGINDQITIDPAKENLYNFADETFTIELWTKSNQINNLNTSPRIISKGLSPYGPGGWGLSLNNGIVGMKFKSNDAGGGNDAYFRDSDTPTNNPDCKLVNDSTWHHVAIVSTTDTNVSDGNSFSINIYIDGKLCQGNPTNNNYSYTVDTHPLVIGSRGSRYIPGNYYFDFYRGSLNEVRVSKGARYTSNFTPKQVLLNEPGVTVGLWHIQDGAGTVVNDASKNTDGSSNNANGTLSQNYPTNVPESNGTTEGPIWRNSTWQTGY